MAVRAFPYPFCLYKPATPAPPSAALLWPSNLTYLGGFRTPNYFDGNGEMSFGGNAIAYNVANNSLFITGHSNGPNGSPIAEITIETPAQVPIVNMNIASVLQGWVNPNIPNPIPGFTDKGVNGGLLVHNGQLLGTVQNPYSTGGQPVEIFVMDSLTLATANVTGLFDIGGYGRVAAGMLCDIPPAWQAPLGHTVGCGLWSGSTVSTLSNGPCCIGFNPEDLGPSSAPATAYVKYDTTNPLSDEIANAPFTRPYPNPIFNGSSGFPGYASHGGCFPAGSGTFLAVYSLASTFAGYGGGLYPQDLPTPIWNDAGDTGTRGNCAMNGECIQPLYFYDAADFLAVKNGTKQPYQVLPYCVLSLTLGKSISGVAYDSAHQIVYMSCLLQDTIASGSALPVIYAYQLNFQSPPASAAPVIGSLTACPNPVLPANSIANGTINPNAPDSQTTVTLLAGNVFPAAPGKSISGVNFWISNANTGTPDSNLGGGTQSSGWPNSTHDWLLTHSVVGLVSGAMYTVFAQATDSGGYQSAVKSYNFLMA